MNSKSTEIANRRFPRNERERGSVLLLTLFLTMLGVWIASTMFISATSQYRTALAHRQISQGNWLAEAAIMRAIGELNRNAAWRAGFTNIPFGGGTYSLTVQALDKQLMKLSAEGRIGVKVRRTIEVIYDTNTKKVLSWKEG
ncbi:hypothetical protein [Collibacillus ludicampi]|nr:hypothetical protein [Collibacillus ludicampi]